MHRCWYMPIDPIRSISRVNLILLKITKMRFTPWMIVRIENDQNKPWLKFTPLSNGWKKIGSFEINQKTNPDKVSGELTWELSVWLVSFSGKRCCWFVFTVLCDTLGDTCHEYGAKCQWIISYLMIQKSLKLTM